MLVWLDSSLNADLTYLYVAFTVMNDQFVLKFCLFSQSQTLTTPDINPPVVWYIGAEV